MQAAQVQAAQSFVESVFDGSFNNGTYPPLSATLPGVTLEALKHTLALVSLQGCSGKPESQSRCLPPSTGSTGNALLVQIKTRAFGAYADAHVNFPSGYMLPIIDLLNHHDDANTQKVGE